MPCRFSCYIRQAVLGWNWSWYWQPLKHTLHHLHEISILDCCSNKLEYMGLNWTPSAPPITKKDPTTWIPRSNQLVMLSHDVTTSSTFTTISNTRSHNNMVFNHIQWHTHELEAHVWHPFHLLQPHHIEGCPPRLCDSFSDGWVVSRTVTWMWNWLLMQWW